MTTLPHLSPTTSRFHVLLSFYVILLTTIALVACFKVSTSLDLSHSITVTLVHRKNFVKHDLPVKKHSVNNIVLLDRIRLNLINHKLRRVLTETPSSQPATSEFQSAVISGSSLGLGEYFVSLDVGTPPQKVLLILDTGSDLTWMKCFSCSNCSSSTSSPIFCPNLSSSFNPVNCWSGECQLVSSPPYCRDLISKRCNYEVSYADRSVTTGFLIYETVTLESGSRTSDVQLRNLAMGCANKISGQTLALSGVIGLGQGPLSFISQTGQAYGNKFSYCLSDFFGPPTITSSLTFGESVVLGSTLQFTPLIRNPYVSTYYYVAVEVVQVDEKVLSIPASEWDIDPSGYGGTIVDSGVTLAHFSSMAYVTILMAFESAISYSRTNSANGLELCYNLTGISTPQFPKFSITFQGNATFQPPQENYFTDMENNVKCLAMQRVTSSSRVSVIGNLLQQNFEMEFDRSKNRLGFRPADCSKRS